VKSGYNCFKNLRLRGSPSRAARTRRSIRLVDRPPSPRAERHEQIQAAVRQVHAESHTASYEGLKIANKLRERPDLESACRNTGAQAMRELGLKSRIAKAFTPTTTQSEPSKQRALNQLASKAKPAQKPGN
jgi:hypothetical protein